jgi:hypothetical protein
MGSIKRVRSSSEDYICSEHTLQGMLTGVEHMLE